MEIEPGGDFAGWVGLGLSESGGEAILIALHEGIDGEEQDLLFGGEVIVNQPTGEACGFGDLRDGGPLIASPRHHPNESVCDLLPPLLRILRPCHGDL
jgi:hypothetical protein